MLGWWGEMEVGGCLVGNDGRLLWRSGGKLLGRRGLWRLLRRSGNRLLERRGIVRLLERSSGRLLGRRGNHTRLGLCCNCRNPSQCNPHRRRKHYPYLFQDNSSWWHWYE